jgi:hypothetical protein
LKSVKDQLNMTTVAASSVKEQWKYGQGLNSCDITLVCDDQTASTQNYNLVQIGSERSERRYLSVAHVLEICATYVDWGTEIKNVIAIERFALSLQEAYILLKFIMEDESWVFAYDSEMKWSDIWMAHQHVTLKEKFTCHKILAESHAYCYSWQRGCSALVVPVGQVNPAFCIKVLKHLRDVIHWKNWKREEEIVILHRNIALLSPPSQCISFWWTNFQPLPSHYMLCILLCAVSGSFRDSGLRSKVISLCP